jgi:dihydrolipoamide dehydrogenase
VNKLQNDILVLGGGPGGYYAAIRGAQLGAKVVVVEKENLGGTCLNWGCIPTKALYRNAEIMYILKHAKEFGINVENYSVDVDKIQERKHGVVKQLVTGIQQLMDAYKIQVVKGTGILKDKNTVTVTSSNGEVNDVTAKNIIIATGSVEALPGIPGIDLEGLMTSNEALEFKKVPKHLVVVGGGVIGIEFATIFHAMGSEVTVIVSKAILKRMDSDLTKRLEVSLKKRGLKFHKEGRAKRIEKENEMFAVYADGKNGEVKMVADEVLIASGRKANVEGINLEGIGVEFSAKGIVVDENFETNIKGVYAIGDVIGRAMLAHVASHHGISAVESIMGIKSKINHDVIPDCVFTFPEVAGVGITEDEAKLKGIEYKTSKFPFAANGKALTLGESEGLIKVIANSDDEVIGVHIMGPHASDLIHEGTLAISNKLKIDAIAHTIHAHPTLSETFAEAILGLKNEAIHAVPSKR